MNQLTRRDFLGLCGTSSFSLLLAACGVTPTPNATLAPTLAALPTSTPLPAAMTTETYTPASTRTATAIATPHPSTLRDYADKLKIAIGVNFTRELFPNAKWREVVGNQFNYGVIESGIWWAEVEWRRGRLDFSTLDAGVRFAQEKKMRIRGQHLVYVARTLPDWLVTGNFSRDELIEILRNHVIQFVARYKGQIAEWVVVNEPHMIPYNQEYDFFWQKIGPEYTDIAFQAARESDSAAKLIFNDSENHTPSGVTTKQTKEIVNRLNSKGLIDGVGLQMHLNGNKPPSKQDVIATMKSYGVPVHVTEFDVRLDYVTDTQEERFLKQAQIYKDMLEASLESGVCTSFSFYDLGDKYSWLAKPQYKGSPNAQPTMFDDDLQPKPAYFAVLQVLQKFTEQHPG